LGGFTELISGTFMIFVKWIVEFLLVLIWFPLSKVSRKWWRVLTERIVQGKSNLFRKESVDFLEILLRYEEKARWPVLFQLISTRKNIKWQMTLATEAFALYFFNEMFDDAISACRFQQSLAMTQIKRDPQAAKESLYLSRQFWTWDLGLPSDQRIESEDVIATMREIERLGGYWVEAYRNAKLCEFLVQWILANDSNLISEYIAAHRINANPIGFIYLRIDFEFFEELGVDEFTFRQFLTDAEKF
jgi:hypothetical protein